MKLTQKASSIAKYAGLIIARWIAAVIAVVVIPTFIVGIILFIAGIFGILFLCWALGFKITITEGGKVIGYIRWTKFYPINKGL